MTNQCRPRVRVLQLLENYEDDVVREERLA